MIDKLRKKIDSMDSEILKLLNERAKVALKINKVKEQNKESYYSPQREKTIFEKLSKMNKGPFPNESVISIFKEIISASRSVGRPLKIAYWGPEATYTHLAAMMRFGSSVKYIPISSLSDIFIEVERKRCDYGVVPIENSTEGVVNYTLDIFVDSELKICSEIMLKISHNLLSTAKSIKEIKKVYGNSQSFSQSRRWLDNNLPNIELVEVSTTAEAAKMTLKDSKGAAIASALAAKIYNLNILAKGIEDISDNFTRFLVVSMNYTKKSRKDKTSIMFSVKDKVGALHSMLVPFEKYKINLTNIESRPSRKRVWEYYFFIDFLGHIEDQNVKLALKELEKKCIFLKILGSYPVSE